MKTLQEIMDSATRKIAGIAGENEFRYTTVSWVKPDTAYTIYYTSDMEEFYITDSIIPRRIYNMKSRSAFTRYKASSSNTLTPTKFATPYEPKVTKKNRKGGFMYRYFVRQANNKLAPIIEIKDSAYSTPLTFYSKLKIKYE